MSLQTEQRHLQHLVHLLLDGAQEAADAAKGGGHGAEVGEGRQRAAPPRGATLHIDATMGGSHFKMHMPGPNFGLHSICSVPQTTART